MYFELNSIELLGYAKQYITEAEDKAIDIPQIYLDKLRDAHLLLSEVQEFLFNS